MTKQYGAHVAQFLRDSRVFCCIGGISKIGTCCIQWQEYYRGLPNTAVLRMYTIGGDSLKPNTHRRRRRDEI